jgi:hypothetical protein
LKFMKPLEYFRIGFNRIKLHKFTEVINKTHIVFILTDRF